VQLKATSPAQLQELLALLGDRRPHSFTATAEVPADRQLIRAAISSTMWPEAVDSSLIVSEEDEPAKRLRASSILSSFVNLLPGKRFLDFGCGEGHVAVEAARRGARAVGYDPVAQGWDPDLATLTTDLQGVIQGGPYDIALLYDVLDHLPDGYQVPVLQQLRSLLTPDGWLYVRCHPWTSAHGTHLYRTLNRSHAHLLLSDQELTALGCSQEPVCRVVRPIDAYHDWFQQAGFRVGHENLVRLELDPVFSDPAVVAELLRHWEKDGVIRDQQALHLILSIQFADYHLTPAP